MKRSPFFLTFFAVVLMTAASAFAQQAANKVELFPLYPNLTFKKTVELVVPPDDSGREFLVLQAGKIVILPDDKNATEVETWLDVSDREMIENGFEEGLLGLTFHPGFKENGKFYIFYSMQGPKVARISEVIAADGGKAVDLSTERVLLEIPQPFWNHNSGNMIFGPDGMLYIAVGDGGKRDDPHNLSQNLFVLNGKILRIDVDSRTGRLPYGIPKDNPFKAKDGVRPEIWTYGMRNPWGLAFTEDGTFLCADVGQEHWEEINVIKPGKNYGWNYREGNELFYKRPADPPAGGEFEDPIFQYDHSQGISITGGYVYQGDAIPWLKGQYIYGDWGFGTIWGLELGGETPEATVLFKKKGNKKAGFKPTAFCEGADGEMRVLSWVEGVYGIREVE